MGKLKSFNRDQLSNLSFREIIDKIAEGEVFQNILEISDDDMQDFYKISMDYFNNKQFKEASDCFLFLTALNPFESNLWIKSGNAEYALGHFQEALSAYSMAMLWDANDPFPHFYSAEAYQMLGDLHHAKECIIICLRLIDEHTEYRPLREPAHKLLELITRR
jgi:type III secretion system low calcium response chaperone LcrH/SycD